MVAFAVLGGEYGVTDVMALGRRLGGERDAIRSLRHQVDSLARLERALTTDPATQERIAREVYGMIRPGELLYQVVPGDSARRQ